MKRETIQRIILFAAIALIGTIGIQVYWINSALDIETKELERQTTLDSLNRTEFNDRVKVALTNVAENILTINNDPAELYKAVEQLRPNYFVVRINDTLHPYLLERLLQESFDKSNIDEDYRYGIYDCFTDSIVYSDIVTDEGVGISDSVHLSEMPQIKWDTDGHYFSITFPNKSNIMYEPIKTDFNIWTLSVVATSIMLAFITYSIWIILRQKRLSETKNDFINNMTHELKTPISTISLSSEVLLRQDITSDPDRVQRYAQIIYDENARLQNQVERVLQLAKLDRGEIALKLSDLSVHELIENACQRFKLIVEDRQGTLSCSLKANHDVVSGDKVHITNIIYNLLDNANKYSKGAPSIVIDTENYKNGIRISITDKGIGMSRESTKQIFEKFYRVPTGNLHDVKGFGLGLYYVKELLLKHKGTIDVNSSPGKGSCFTIWLPNK